MKASELRIGNLIFTHKEEIIVVKGIDTEGLILFKEDQNIFDFKCKPIPLTEEWLINFGMEYTDGFSSSRRLYFNNHEYDLSQVTYNEKEGLLRFSNGHPKGTSLIPHIKYVHQLQNLYFALTGEELTIKD